MRRFHWIISVFRVQLRLLLREGDSEEYATFFKSLLCCSGSAPDLVGLRSSRGVRASRPKVAFTRSSHGPDSFTLPRFRSHDIVMLGTAYGAELERRQKLQMSLEK